ncbi:hypothetical protein GGR51DRAFT_517454 [Nemania sp. FL0031]|nr:hypothetical protein GGR51DRAFT_517454 [Nemania sp. FL0031]
MSAIVTPSMRTAGWNVEFTIGPSDDEDVFAGIYTAPGSGLITFSDVCDEMRISFKDGFILVGEETSDDTSDVWDSIAFSLHVDPDMPILEGILLFFVTKEDQNQPIPTHPQKQKILRYHVVFHKDCNLPRDSRLDDHLRAGCAQQLSDPPRRYDHRYIPLTEAKSYDPKLSFMPLQPLRKELKTHSRSKPLGLPKQLFMDDADEIRFVDMLAPLDSKIDIDEAKRVESIFRSSCLNRGSCCIVSGEGNPWCPGVAIGPGVEACHIIPQQHYYLYPLGADNDNFVAEPSPRGLRMAWEKTWSFPNGILLMKHLHEFFDRRLFSINPETLRIRVFVPYDALLRFNGKKASVHPQVDRRALRQHYDMCCIENMAALKLYRRDPILWGTSSTTPDSGDTTLGDSPSEKTSPSPPNQRQPGGASSRDNLVTRAEAVLREDQLGHKRKRLQDDEADNQTSPLYEKDEQDGYITPQNSRRFLADVNWELRRFKARQHARGNPV